MISFYQFEKEVTITENFDDRFLVKQEYGPAEEITFNEAKSIALQIYSRLSWQDRFMLIKAGLMHEYKVNLPC